MGADRPTRAQLVRRRWRLVSAVALLTFVLSFLIGRLQRESLERLAKLPDWSLVVVVAAGAALFAMLSPRRFVAALGLRHPFTYPPYWFGIAIGIAVSLGLIATTELFAEDFNLSEDARYYLGSISVVFVTAITIALAAGFFQWLFSGGFRLKERIWTDPKLPSLDDFQVWLRNDDPVLTPNRDLFGHSGIAKRMGQRLLNEKSAQALVGRLGSGKSTVCAFVEAWLKDQRSSTEVVRIELWPYESPRAAVEGILTSVVEALSREVSTSQLDGLPSAYGEAIAKISGVGDWLPKVLRKQTIPAASLQALDDVATMIGRRYILWVEDLERFAAGDPNAPAGDSELERLAPIRAVLHGLDQLRSITVVTATTDLFRRFDMEKIARYVERIPELKFREVRRIISTIRHQLFNAGDALDPAPSEARNRLGWDDPNKPQDERLELAWLGDSIGTFASAVSVLAATPRILKQGLRRVMDTWETLKGEIDLDDLIALSILREASPGLFALVDRHANALRGGHSRRRNEANPMDVFVNALREQTGEDAHTFEAVRLIVDELFGHEARRRPQGVSHDNHADYWQRFLANPDLDAHERDQNVLKILRANDDEQLADLLVSGRSNAVEDFAHLLSPRRIERLILPLTHRLLDADITKWSDNRPPGLVPLWRMLRRHQRNIAETAALVAQIEQALELAAPRNLLLLYEIAHWMASSVPEVSDLLPEANDRRRINDRARDLLVETYRDRPQELASNLRGAPVFLLVWLCWTIERVRADTTRGIPFEKWASFAQTLLEALPIDAAVVAPQIASFVVRSRRRLRAPDEWSFDESQARKLFGDVDKLIESIRAATVGMELDPRVQAVVQCTPEVSAVNDDDDVDGVGDEYWDDDGEGGGVDECDHEGQRTTSNSPPSDGIDDTTRAARTIAREAGVRPRAGAVSGQADGYWYERLEAIPPSRPGTRPSAILSEKGDLGEGSLCLLLVEAGGEWVPLSEAGVDSHVHAGALVEGQERYFVLANDWSAVYRVVFDGWIDTEEVRRFGDVAYDRARLGSRTIVIVATRATQRQPEAVPVSTSPEPTREATVIAPGELSHMNEPLPVG